MTNAGARVPVRLKQKQRLFMVPAWRRPVRSRMSGKGALRKIRALVRALRATLLTGSGRSCAT